MVVFGLNPSFSSRLALPCCLAMYIFLALTPSKVTHPEHQGPVRNVQCLASKQGVNKFTEPVYLQYAPLSFLLFIHAPKFTCGVVCTRSRLCCSGNQDQDIYNDSMLVTTVGPKKPLFWELQRQTSRAMITATPTIS